MEGDFFDVRVRSTGSQIGGGNVMKKNPRESIPPSSARLDAARDRFVAVFGDAAVLEESSGLGEFRDPFEGPDATRHQPAFVVQPESVEQVQAALCIAQEEGIRLWTSSMGRNFGYGGSAPVMNGGVVLNLRRMNRILEIDVPNAYARIEPGVTFFQLYEALRAQDAPLMMSVPDLGWGSMIGNGLEHGFGYAVMGDHGSALCGLEVILANGTIVRTGQGAITGSPLWNCHRRGFGPAIDDMFKQSNFGIVTKAGVWLMPRPEIIATGTIRCENDGDIIPLLAMLRRLMLEGIVQGIPMIVGTPSSQATDGYGSDAFTFGNLRKVLRPGRWSARIGLYGHATMIAARREIIKLALAEIPGASLELREYPGDAKPADVEPRDLISAGIPNMVLQDRLKAVFGDSLGHMDFSPVLPCTGEAALKAEQAVYETLARHDLIGTFGMLLTGRSMVSASMILFDAANPLRVQAAHMAVGELYDRAGQWGCTAYRAHISLVDHVAAKQGFNDHALAQVYATLKDAFDPSGILSPGNHGIWPGRSIGQSDSRPIARDI
ncbi:FAD-binding oxidoreductase [Sphingomonas sp. AR_OL41]|uniref:FAD-binding oxidoreductase n=1 Tax=Sphingomonas sp. AR_OL41 TaxID=3042729 RepID=UPI00248065E6|nr:FAD-binding oxidoreductase [Sphingomonas sp. AR_OL41]MDH7973649.1 FAD-binding oxidoreductase [Sphingomonas sp. AR_OL41]